MNPPFTEELRRCRETLEALLADPALLAGLPKEERAALLTAAGRLSRPTKIERLKAARALRRESWRRRQELDRAARARTDIRQARRKEVFYAPGWVPPQQRPPGPELQKPRACYACKTQFKRLHFFYDALCPACAELNYDKRFQKARLEGKVALITGARLKIGYQASLMLLRCGAKVVATTRFPRDAAKRYAREPDFSAWSDRLQIYGLDLRHTPSVEIFARHLDQTLERLDILINNAAQTVRRPAGFYDHLLEEESLPLGKLPKEIQKLLQSHDRCVQILEDRRPAVEPVGEDLTGLSVWHGGKRGIGLTASAALSQLRHTHDDAFSAPDVFPAGRRDADLQQVDLRLTNSWRMTLAEVPTAEMLEVHLVNAVAPFILCGKLKGLMLRTGGAKHVVNVSAMEGSFSRGTKTDKHPHTNMAKAALNMMTLTSAADYAKSGIYMNAVDTGWVTDEDPAAHSARKQAEHDFQPPLDIVDGAARVLDPVLSGYNSGEHPFGKFFKDYAPTDW